MEREEGIAMASEVLQTISKDEAERFRLMSEYKHELDIQSKLVYAKREAMKQGEKRGLKRGLKRGMEEGIKEGMKESRVEIARNALAKGASIEFVREITGLDIETIRKIQAKLS